MNIRKKAKKSTTPVDPNEVTITKLELGQTNKLVTNSE